MSIDWSKFQVYKERAIVACRSLSFQEKSAGVWTRPEVVDYFASLPVDAATKFLAQSLKDIFPDGQSRKILIGGGGTGKLGREVAQIYPEFLVTEVDSSLAMVNRANLLVKNYPEIRDRFESQLGDVRSLSLADNSFDYAITYSVFRYLDPKDWLTATRELLRVSRYGVTIAEGKAQELITNLRDQLDPKLEIMATEMPMFRTSIFYILMKMYDQEPEFRSLVLQEKSLTLQALLSQLAGEAPGVLYELRLKK